MPRITRLCYLLVKKGMVRLIRPAFFGTIFWCTHAYIFLYIWDNVCSSMDSNQNRDAWMKRGWYAEYRVLCVFWTQFFVQILCEAYTICSQNILRRCLKTYQ